MADMNNNSGANSGSVLKAPENMLHPRDYVAPSSANEQSRGAVNEIQALSESQTFNNSCQGTGIAGPSVWGGPDSMKGSTSSAEAGSKQGQSAGVDLVSGQNGCWNGGKPYKE